MTLFGPLRLPWGVYLAVVALAGCAVAVGLWVGWLE